MGWFYTEYVCGTQLPSYRMNATFDRGRQGAGGRAQDVGLSMKMTRSTGSDNFPRCWRRRSGTAGWQVFLGSAQLTGNGRFDEKIPVKGLKDKLKRAAINYYDDALLSPNQIAADREPRMNRGALACSPVAV
jgi:hypothetical protein